ncbi:MAG: hypothetical protein E7471_00525 [Ruminococcaceae bacterium]|nr:hypothetical protein [Oscillospiraceae bacterium]
MKQKKNSVKIAMIGLAVLLLAGVFAIAAEYGTQSDPLVSKGYIDSVFAPQLLSQVDSLVAQKLGNASSEIQAAQDIIDQKMSEFESRQLSVSVDQAFMDNVSNRVIQTVQDQSYNQSTFRAVTVPAGKQLILSVGSEMVLQAGTGKCVSSLLDTTTGAVVSTGGSVPAFHLYLASAQGSGVKASTQVTALVRGAYQIQ